MRNMRVIGATIRKALEDKCVSREQLAKEAKISANDLEMVIYGRKILSFSQLSKIADYLDIKIDLLIEGDINYYTNTVVDCMNGFENEENREKILDLVYDYMDLLDASKGE